MIVPSPEAVGGHCISLEDAHNFKEVFGFPWKVLMQTLRSFQGKEFKSIILKPNFDTSYFEKTLQSFCSLLNEKQESTKL